MDRCAAANARKCSVHSTAWCRWQPTLREILPWARPTPTRCRTQASGTIAPRTCLTRPSGATAPRTCLTPTFETMAPGAWMARRTGRCWRPTLGRHLARSHFPLKQPPPRRSFPLHPSPSHSLSTHSLSRPRCTGRRRTRPLYTRHRLSGWRLVRRRWMICRLVRQGRTHYCRANSRHARSLTTGSSRTMVGPVTCQSTTYLLPRQILLT